MNTTTTDQPDPSTTARSATKRRRWRIAIVAAVVILPVLAWLAFGYFGVQFLFIDDRVDEANPFVGETTATVDVTTEASGPFEDRAHPTSGTATVITDGTERFVRFEDFATDNGPDLNVYLAPGGDVDSGFVDLGNLKGNIGPQNYELDRDIDLDTYDTVVIWCVRFSVSFGEATLLAA